MSFSDETLIAYVEGELDELTRHALETAMYLDPLIAQRVARLKAQRCGRSAPFAPARDDTALHGHAPPPRGATVVQLDTARASRAVQQNTLKKNAGRSGWSWLEWSALAATLVVGLVVGRFGLSELQAEGQAGSIVATKDGALTAQGMLSVALSQQLTGLRTTDGSVGIGLSFVSNQGNYCRSFMLNGMAQDLAGLACRNGEQWRILVMAQKSRQAAQSGGYGVMMVEFPFAVLEAIDQRIDGAALDARAEQDALRKGWQR